MRVDISVIWRWMCRELSYQLHRQCNSSYTVCIFIYYISTVIYYYYYYYYWIRNDPISLLILLLFFCLGWRSSKSLRLHCFQSDWGEIWQDCSSKYALINGVGIFDMMPYFQDSGQDVRPPLSAAYAPASASCSLACRLLASLPSACDVIGSIICITVPDP